MRSQSFALAWVVACFGVFARAQGQSDAGTARDAEVLAKPSPTAASAALAFDPIGLDESTGRDLDEAAEVFARLQRAAAHEKETARVLTSEVLSALEGVTEHTHNVQITLRDGLAFVTETLTFRGKTSRPAEIAYRLPLPEHAAVYRARVCQQGRCFAALPLASDAALTARPAQRTYLVATPMRDHRGPAFALRAGSVEANAELVLEIAYVADAAVHAGKARFRLPARGDDARLAKAQLSVACASGLALRDKLPVELDATEALTVYADSQPGNAKVMRSLMRDRCGGRACARRFALAPNAALVTRDTWLLLDASPSMEGAARNRADQVLSALLASAPPQTPLRVMTFAAHAETVGDFMVQSAPLKRLSDALLRDLGAASRPGRALQATHAELNRARPLVLILSDGKLDVSARRELRAAVSPAVESWLLNVATEAPTAHELLPALFLGGDDFARRDPERLADQLAMLYAPHVGRDGLRGGEQQVQEQVQRRAYVPRPNKSWLSYWFAAEPTRLATAVGAPPELVAAQAFVSTAPPAAQALTSMPKESVLTMLRNQLIPQARRCLRSDRKGRSDYAVALTFHALFADREAYDVHIEGDLAEPLRNCLWEVVYNLRIPAFAGRIRVRYPIHTERELPPPSLSFEP